VSNSPAKMLLIAVGTLFVVLLIINASTSNEAAYVTAAKKYYEEIRTNQSEKLYDTTCAAIKGKTSKQKLAGDQENAWKQVVAAEGALKKVSVTGTQHLDSIATVELKFEHEKRTLFVQAHMTREDGKWRYCGSQYVSQSGVVTETTAVSTTTTTATAPAGR
jgi:hypothetical protein